MTLAPPFPPALAKEIRGVGMTWLTAVAAVVVAAALDVPFLPGIEIAAYLLGSVSLGAVSMGQEYSHRTLPLWLSQPAPRARLFVLKFGVLAVTQVTLAAIAVPVVGVSVPGMPPTWLAVLPPLGGVCLAPWLTMAFRSPIAGAAFTLALPGTLMTGYATALLLAYGHMPSGDAQVRMLEWGTLGLCAIGASLSWPTFARLEAVDGPGPALGLPRWLERRADAAPASAAEHRHPLWLLARKELDLQRMTVAMAGFYGLGWLATVALASRVPEAPAVLGVLTVFYALVVPVLAGSLASAEERQYGTIEWQMLVPVSAAVQWRVKIAVVWMLSLVLALGLPSVLLSWLNPADPMAHLARLPFILAVIAIATTSLYVSTLCASSLRAALLSVLVLFIAVLPTSYVARSLVVSARPTSPLLNVARLWRAGGFDTAVLGWLIVALQLLLVAGTLLPVARVALVNHRSAEPGGARPLAQAALVVAWLSAGGLLLFRTVVLP